MSCPQCPPAPPPPPVARTETTQERLAGIRRRVEAAYCRHCPNGKTLQKQVVDNILTTDIPWLLNQVERSLETKGTQ